MSCLLRPRAFLATAVLTLTSFLVTSPPATATVILSGSGISAAGNPVAATAELTIAGNILTLTLLNTSPVASDAPADVLSSFYFDIVKSGNRPTLTYASGEGYVWQVRKNQVDLPFNYTPPAVAGGTGTYLLANPPETHTLSDLMGTKDGDRTWQFRPMDISLAPFEGFGLGTVGNSLFSPNGFDPAIVGPPGNEQIAFGIYRDLAGDITPVGALQDQFLVRNQATFTFSGVSGFTEADIVPATFGFGTGPDSIISVPEPGTGALALAGLSVAAALLCWRRHPKPLSAGMAAAGSLAVAIAVMPHAQAAPIAVDDAYDFTTSDHNWQPMAVGVFSPPPLDKRWQYAGGQWSVKWSAVNGPLVANGNYLTSPVMQVSQKIDGVVDLIRISLSHEFNFDSGTGPVPPAAGQLAFSINGGAFQGIPLESFRVGSLTDSQPPFTPPLDPIPTSLVDQLELVQPSFLPPTSGYSSLFPLINDGAAFVGTSPNYGTEGGWFVPSIATISIELTVIESFQVRLINANLGSVCLPGDTWNVRYVQADFAAMPEPGGMALAGCGVGVTAAWTALARKRQAAKRSFKPAERTDSRSRLPAPLKA